MKVVHPGVMEEISTPLGRRCPDVQGSPVGVVRLDPERAYAGTGLWLQRVIDHQDAEAWAKIKEKIDYLFASLDLLLGPLQQATGFHQEIKARLQKGKKLLFKPNLVSPVNIDPLTHGPGLGNTACTEWPLVAAGMRWFHDRMDIPFHCMILGEAATAISAVAGAFSLIHPQGRAVTPEAVIEGRSDDFYGGWGFYFVRKYLAENALRNPEDDPLKGYEDSLEGHYAPPGRVRDRLMVIDLNRIDDRSKGREIPVPNGVNFQTITLHTAVVGGDPKDPAAEKDYPGCVLINLPKMKVHNMALFTNVIKNLGIGLYPMQFSKTGDCCWEYSNPHQPIPGMKGGVPHEVWVPEMDRETCLPRWNPDGSLSLKKTGGLTATMVDIIRAVQNQDVYMLHLVDAVEATNIDHMGTDQAQKSAEGLLVAGLDPVATDWLCARYLFSNVPMAEALATDLDDGMGGRFPQAVPIPKLKGKAMVTEKGYDSPLARDDCFSQAEARGMGQRRYFVLGWDQTENLPLVSVEGHLGRVRNGVFEDLVTRTLYFDYLKMPWDLQKTALAYWAANDTLAGTSLTQEFLSTFDEDGDGVVSYWETGRKGVGSLMLHQGGYSVACMATDPLAFLSGRVKSQLVMLRLGEPSRNPYGLGLVREFQFGSAAMVAYRLSQVDLEVPDLFIPELIWGKGQWPSFQTAQYFLLGISLYGQGFPFQVGFPSLYGSTLFYADLVQWGGKYFRPADRQLTAEPVLRYVHQVQQGETAPLDFVFYVPPGFEKLGETTLPNVEVTEDPTRVLTVHFQGGKEIWGAL